MKHSQELKTMKQEMMWFGSIPGNGKLVHEHTVILYFCGCTCFNGIGGKAKQQNLISVKIK